MRKQKKMQHICWTPRMCFGCKMECKLLIVYQKTPQGAFVFSPRSVNSDRNKRKQLQNANPVKDSNADE